MSCFYCWQQQVNTPHAGSCAECNRPVCIRPPARSDGEYHGDTCVCGCGKLICEQDVQTHAVNSHGSSASNCFSLLTLMTGVPALCAVLAEQNSRYSSRLPTSTARAATRFLNSTGPGAAAVRSATEPLSNRELTQFGLERSVAPDGLQDIVLQNQFLSDSSRRERLGAAVAYTLGDVWRGIRSSSSTRQFLDEFPEHSPPVLYSLLETFSRRAFAGQSHRSAQFLGLDDVRTLHKQLNHWWLVGFDLEAKWFEGVIANNTPPDEPAALASWIVFGEEPDTRPTVGGRLRTRGA